ncbi:MAG: cytidine deaminase [Acholeplasmatales bacterium]|nr:cytidine deaminase [Acholeplasmatales bacterium]
MNFNVEELIKKAIIAKSNSYSPYSNFKVGCAILLKDNNYILGCNVENKSYGLTICAERNALFKMVSEGYKKEDVIALAITSSGDALCTPCGACREVMDELLKKDTLIVLANDKLEYKIVKNNELLPLAFKLEK